MIPEIQNSHRDLKLYDINVTMSHSFKGKNQPLRKTKIELKHEPR